MARKGGNAGNRTVVYLSDENFLWVNARLMTPGETKVPFGHMSKFFNRLIEDARTREILKEQPK